MIRRLFIDQFRRDAVQMLLDGHSAQSVAECLGPASPNLLYIWKQRLLRQTGPVAPSRPNQ